MKMLAHQGTKFYNQQFDLIYRTEAPTPNAIWQADHTQLDVIVKGNDIANLG
jgi:putative transposase